MFFFSLISSTLKTCLFFKKKMLNTNNHLIFIFKYLLIHTSVHLKTFGGRPGGFSWQSLWSYRRIGARLHL